MSDADIFCSPYLEQRYEITINKIIDLIYSPIYRTANLLLTGESPAFVLCGVSGSGKTLSIKLANAKLPENEQIAESDALLMCTSSYDAYQILLADRSRYVDAKYIAYTIVRKRIGIELIEHVGSRRVVFID